jgi:hypothetical protein
VPCREFRSRQATLPAALMERVYNAARDEMAIVRILYDHVLPTTAP